MWSTHFGEQQAELFPDARPSGRRRRHRWAPLFPLTRWTVSVSYEQLVLGAVTLVLTGLTLFALGMERGRHMVRAAAPLAVASRAIPVRAAAVAAPAAVVAARPVAAPVLPAPGRPLVAAAPATAPAAAQPPAATPTASRYTIQLATYSQATLAEAESRQLRKRGHQPFLIAGGKFATLCVGSFKTRQDAQRQLAAFRSSYRDCFIRQR